MKRLLAFLILTVASCLALAITSSASSDTGSDEFTYKGLIAFAVVSLIVALIIFFVSVIPRYRKKKRGSSYPLKEFTDLELTAQYDMFITKTVTRRRYRSSSSSKR